MKDSNVEDPVYKPQRGSVPWKVLRFLVQNPDEELTRGDIAVKFDTFGGSVDTLLARAVAMGALKKARNSETELTWILGSAGKVDLGDLADETVIPSIAAVTSLPWKSFKPSNPGDDPELIPLDDNVPLIGPRAASTTNWAALLDRMQPGQSCALPMEKRSVLSRTIAQYHKANKGTFTLRVLPGKREFRIWRTA